MNQICIKSQTRKKLYFWFWKNWKKKEFEETQTIGLFSTNQVVDRSVRFETVKTKVKSDRVLNSFLDKLFVLFWDMFDVCKLAKNFFSNQKYKWFSFKFILWHELSAHFVNIKCMCCRLREFFHEINTNSFIFWLLKKILQFLLSLHYIWSWDKAKTLISKYLTSMAISQLLISWYLDFILLYNILKITNASTQKHKRSRKR